MTKRTLWKFFSKFSMLNLGYANSSATLKLSDAEVAPGMWTKSAIYLSLSYSALVVTKV